MLSDDVTRYLDMRSSLGFKDRMPRCLLRRFAEFAAARGDIVVRSQTVIDWAAEAPSAAQRRGRLYTVRRFALHMQAEDACYEVPPASAFGNRPKKRRMPHIYTVDEVQRLLAAAGQLTPSGSMRPTTYVALLSLLFATGVRICEALAFQLEDITSDGLVIRRTKFRKSRLVPLHPTARCGLERYVALRTENTTTDRSVFISLWGTGLRYSTVCAVFLQLARSIGLRGGPGTAGPRIHDARHTFAVRALEACSGNDAEVAHHILALSTYLGHAHPSDTFWYLHATPKLMAGIACAGELLFEGGRS
jgi:integrase